MRLLQKIGLAVATLVLLAGTAVADHRFSVQVYSRPRVYRTYTYPAYTYPVPGYYTYPQSYYTYSPGYSYYSTPGYYNTYRPGTTYSYTWGNRRHHRGYWRR